MNEEWRRAERGEKDKEIRKWPLRGKEKDKGQVWRGNT